MSISHIPLRRSAARLALACLLSACAPAIVAPPAVPPEASSVPPPAAAVSDFHRAYYDSLRGDEPVLAIAPLASLIAITVRRAGALAHLGHDHVVASHTVEGFIAPKQGRADFHFRLDQLSVDEAELREQAGLATQPSAAAIDGTRNNMLNKVLDAARFPDVTVQVTRAATHTPGAPLGVAITLHGVTRTMSIPVEFELNKVGDMVASGRLTLKQSDFGLVPFSVMGGAMAVQDQMELRFRLVASAL
ncbi:hypothetical protein ACFDR9_002306 [Janthinobacterium sp. CG_23.3]|uniref:YceI family protein n=1 Tax=unclassified Janthinobacterium TaxID=2610881 RepID=UPI0003475E6E|nr:MULTISPECIES: YceI family protein [unclassified Janthinobacterium]MEC5160553.1 hypothetical protein [Janthinobacterium sp. CG_S6]